MKCFHGQSDHQRTDFFAAQLECLRLARSAQHGSSHTTTAAHAATHARGHRTTGPHCRHRCVALHINTNSTFPMKTILTKYQRQMDTCIEDGHSRAVKRTRPYTTTMRSHYHHHALSSPLPYAHITTTTMHAYGHAHTGSPSFSDSFIRALQAPYGVTTNLSPQHLEITSLSRWTNDARTGCLWWRPPDPPLQVVDLSVWFATMNPKDGF